MDKLAGADILGPLSKSCHTAPVTHHSPLAFTSNLPFSIFDKHILCQEFLAVPSTSYKVTHVILTEIL